MTPTELRALAKLTVTDDGETMVLVSKRDLNHAMQFPWDFFFFLGAVSGAFLMFLIILIMGHK